MWPAQPLRQQSVREPAPDHARKAAPLNGRKGADQRSDRTFGSRNLPNLVGQIVRLLVIRSETQRIEHAGDACLGQQFLRGPGRQPAPGQQHPAGRADIVSRPSQQQRVAQGRFVLDTPGLPDRYCRRAERQPLPPCAGPSLLPADRRIECADGGARGDRNVLKGIWPEPFGGKALRVRHGAAQPARQRDRWGGHGCSEQRRMEAWRGFGAQNHRQQDELRRRFWQ